MYSEMYVKVQKCTWIEKNVHQNVRDLKRMYIQMCVDLKRSTALNNACFSETLGISTNIHTGLRQNFSLLI